MKDPNDIQTQELLTGNGRHHEAHLRILCALIAERRLDHRNSEDVVDIAGGIATEFLAWQDQHNPDSI